MQQTIPHRILIPSSATFPDRRTVVIDYRAKYSRQERIDIYTHLLNGGSHPHYELWMRRSPRLVTPSPLPPAKNVESAVEPTDSAPLDRP